MIRTNPNLDFPPFLCKSAMIGGKTNLHLHVSGTVIDPSTHPVVI